VSRAQVAQAVLTDAHERGIDVLVPSEMLLDGMRAVGLFWSVLGCQRLVAFVRVEEIHGDEAWRLITRHRPEFFEW
jgi:hypothetical protein